MRLKEIKEEIEWMINYQEKAQRLMIWALPILQDYIGDQESYPATDKEMLAEFEEFLE